MSVAMISPGIIEYSPSSHETEWLARTKQRSGLPFTPDKYLEPFDMEGRPGITAGYTASIMFLKGQIKPPFLFLFGTPGTGKTHLAAKIGWGYIAEWRSVAYFQVAELLQDLRRRYKDKTFDAQMEWLREVSLLILDDIGVESKTDWAKETLDTLVDYRYRNNKAMVVTSNVIEDISPRILDRLNEGMAVQMMGGSYRGRK